MTLTLYKNFSKRNNSTKQPGTGTDVTVYMKKETSVLHPVFLIESVDLTVNYCQWNGRYYFIDDIVLNLNNIYELHCTFDALATWKSAIGSSTQYVLRSSSTYDGNVIDLFYPTKKAPYVTHIGPTSAPDWATSLSTGWYIVGIIGGSSSSSVSQGVVQYYVFTSAQFNSFTQAVFTESNWLNFQDADRYSFNPIQYIASVIWYPVEPIMGSGVSSVMLGWQSINCSCYELAAASFLYSFSFTTTDHPQAASRGNYLNSAPFSEYFMSFPPFGDITLNSDIYARLYQNKLYSTMKVDFVTGKALLIVRGQLDDVAGDYEFARRSVQLGVTIQLSQIAADRIGTATGAVGTVGGFIGNLLSGNLLGAITGAVSGIGSAYQTAQPHVSSHGVNDSLAGVVGAYASPMLYETFYYVVDEDNADCGRPLCQTKTINTLSGYILCANAEIQFAGLPEERDAIISFMNSGFFYE